MKLLYFLGYLLPFITVAVLLYGCIVHWRWQRSHSHRTIRYYLLFILVIESLSIVLSILGENIALFGVAPFVHFVFYVRIQHQFIAKSHIQLPQILIVASTVPLVGLFSFPLYKASFQSYSNLLFGGMILIISLMYTYAITAGKFQVEKQVLRINYACILFFSLDVFLSVPVNFLINSSYLLVGSFWILRWVFLLLYYVSVIRYRTK